MARVQINQLITSVATPYIVPNASITLTDLEFGGETTIYQSATGVATLNQPLLSNSNGVVPGFVDVGTYGVAVTAPQSTTSYYQFDAASGIRLVSSLPTASAEWEGTMVSVKNSGTTYIGAYETATPGDYGWQRMITDGGVGASAIVVNSPVVGSGVTYDGDAWVADSKPVDLWNSQENPSSVTDWGAIINTMIAAGVRSFFLQGAFPFTTHINAIQTVGVTFVGPGGKVDVYGNSSAGADPLMQGYLLYTGTGTGNALDASGSSGFTMRGIGLYYNHSGFTGNLLCFSNNTAGAVIEGNDIGGWNRGFVSAHSNINFTNSWNCTVRDNTIQGAQYNFYGNDPAGSFTWCDTFRILDNDIAYAVIAHIGGSIRQQWKIARNFFSLSAPPAAATSYPQIMHLSAVTGTGAYVAAFTFDQNDCWDQTSASPPPFQFNQVVDATICNNYVLASVQSSGAIITCTGGGNLRVENNPQMGDSSQAGPMIDLGNTSSGATAFSGVVVRQNGVLASATAGEIIHIAGHLGLEVDGGEFTYESYAVPMHELAGQERITKRLYAPSPTIVALSGLGTSGSVAIEGSDIAGLIHLTASGGSYAAGDLARVVFGATPIADPNGPYGYITGNAGLSILLTPSHIGTSGPISAQVGTNFYTWFDSAHPTHWTIGSTTAPTGYDFWFAYRVLVI